MTIRTYSERTPWGIEFYAIDDDVYDGTPFSRGAGVGPTEADAIADLKIGLEQIDVHL